MLCEGGSARVRSGAAEALARVTEALQLQVVPYIVLLVVPLLGNACCVLLSSGITCEHEARIAIDASCTSIQLVG